MIGTSVNVTSRSVSLPDGAKARRVYLSLRDEIANGIHSAGSHLPGELKLAQTFDVSRVTVRRALESLCADGLVERLAGSGTVVRKLPQGQAPVSMDFTTLLPQLAEMGRNTSVRLLSFGYGNAPDEVSQALGLSSNARVQIATRVRLADGQPFSHLTTYVPEAIASNYSEQDLATTPLFELLERGGVVIDGARQSMSASLASPAVARVLDVAVGSALLSLNRIVRDGDGRGVEYLYARYRPDLFRIDMELTRVHDGSSRQWQPVVALHDPSGKQTREKRATSRRTSPTRSRRRKGQAT